MVRSVESSLAASGTLHVLGVALVRTDAGHTNYLSDLETAKHIPMPSSDAKPRVCPNAKHALDSLCVSAYQKKSGARNG